MKRRRRLLPPLPGPFEDDPPPPGRIETDEGWAEMDALPAELRAALHDSARPIAVSGVAREYKKLLAMGLTELAATNRILADIRGLESREIRGFAVAYRQDQKRPYPHLSAGVSILRYKD